MVSSCVLAGTFVLCLGDQSISFTDFKDGHPSMGGQSKGSSNSKYMGVTKSYQPDLFITD